MARRTQRTREEGDIEVTVLRFGGRPQRVNVEEESTVQDAIDEAGFTVKSGDEVSVNGDTVETDDLSNLEVEDGDQVVLTPRFEGGLN